MAQARGVRLVPTRDYVDEVLTLPIGIAARSADGVAPHALVIDNRGTPRDCEDKGALARQEATRTTSAAHVCGALTQCADDVLVLRYRQVAGSFSNPNVRTLPWK